MHGLEIVGYAWIGFFVLFALTRLTETQPQFVLVETLPFIIIGLVMVAVGRNRRIVP